MGGNFPVPKSRSPGSCLAESTGGVQGCLVDMQVEERRLAKISRKQEGVELRAPVTRRRADL